MLNNLNSGLSNNKSIQYTKLQEEIEALQAQLSSIQTALNNLSNSISTEVVSADTGNIDNVNASLVQASNVNATNGSFDSLSVNSINLPDLDTVNVETLNASNDIVTPHISADDADIASLAADGATITNATVSGTLDADTINVNSLNVNGTITDDINSENVTIQNATIADETVTDSAITNATIDSADITTENVNTSNVTNANVINSNVANENVANLVADKIKTGSLATSYYFRADDSFINLDIDENELGIVKLPYFDGTAKLVFVDSTEVARASITLICDQTANTPQVMVNFSQQYLDVIDSINVGNDGHIYIGVEEANIKKMYYTLDVANNSVDAPVQTSDTTMSTVDVNFDCPISNELNKVFVLGNNGDGYGMVIHGNLDVYGELFIAGDLSLAHATFGQAAIGTANIETANVTTAYIDTGVVENDFGVQGNLEVDGKIGGTLKNKLTIYTSDDPEDAPIEFDNTTSQTIDTIKHAMCDGNGNNIADTYIPLSEKAQPNGVATLDANGRVPSEQLSINAVEYKGEYDASTNTPDLNSLTHTNGDMYIVSVEGTQTILGQTENLLVDDELIYNADKGYFDVISQQSALQLKTICQNNIRGTGNITLSDLGIEII